MRCFAYTGSSPRVRGSRTSKASQVISDGIIPAGAGLTSGDGVDANPAEDHPRGCGAHLPAPVSNVLGAGSSPRVRGSLLALVRDVDAARIIPAGAGLTRFHACTYRPRRDHPRGCGAHQTRFSAIPSEEGSSPRVRGSLKAPPCSMPRRRDHPRGCGAHQHVTHRLNNAIGIIPAGAGLTMRHTHGTERCRDHPRGCGAHMDS